MSTSIRCPICDEEAEYCRESFVYYAIGYVNIPVFICVPCAQFLAKDATNQLRRSKIRDTIRILRGKDKL